MVRLKGSILFLTLLSFATFGFAGDSLKTVSFNSVKLFLVRNQWLNTGNASGLAFNMKNELLTFGAGVLLRNGDYHLIRDPDRMDRFFFSTSSYKQVNSRFYVSGSFAYTNTNEKGARWTGTYEPYRGNPYLLADSLAGVKTHKENFRLSGQAAWVKSKHLILGAGVDYFVAVAAKQKDPRPEITVTFFEFHPSALILKDNFSLGIDAGYNNCKEEISYSTFKSNFNPVFFTFKGFGFYSKEIDYDFYRFQTAHEGFIGIQLDKKFNSFSSLTELRGKYSFEKIEDGRSVIIREDGGDWKTIQFELKESLKRESGRNINLLTAGFSFFDGDGVEYIQDVIFKGNHEEYVTVSKNLKFNRLQIDGKIACNYLRMEKSKIDWDFNVSIFARNNREKYYYIPEVFSSSYLNLTGYSGIQKNFYSGNFHLALTVNASFTSNLSNSVMLSNLPEITKNQRPETFTSEFNHYITDVFMAGGLLQLGYTPDSGKIGQINLSLATDYFKPVKLSSFSLFNCLKIGLVF